MATNLVSLVMQFLTPDIIGRIASALGLDRNTAQTAVTSSVPSLLAAFSGIAAQPGGAQKLVDAAAQQTGALENFAQMLGGENQSALTKGGSQMLSSLLGNRDQGALAGAISRFAGMGQGATGSLLGMLAPVVLGTITQQLGTTRPDPGRLAGLLASQKDNIAAALPAGLGNVLAGTGLRDSLSGAARTAAATSSEAAGWASASAAGAGDAARRAMAASAGKNWLYWLIPIAALAAFLIYLVATPTEQAVQQRETVGQAIAVNRSNVDKQLTDTLASLRTTLGGITDPISAQTALPKLREAAAQIDKIDGLSRQLSTEQRKALASSVNPLLPTLNELFDKALKIPGASEELKPAVDALKAKLTALAA